MSNLTNNTTSLQEILETVNALPEAGGGGAVETCTVKCDSYTMATVCYTDAQGMAQNVIIADQNLVDIGAAPQGTPSEAKVPCNSLIAIDSSGTEVTGSGFELILSRSAIFVFKASPNAEDVLAIYVPD